MQLHRSNCTVVLCKKNHYAKGYCINHYRQLKRHGHILEHSHKDTNNIIIDGEILKIELRDLSHNVVAYAITDFLYVDKLLKLKYKWSLNSKGYARNTKSMIYLHQLILVLIELESSHPRFRTTKELQTYLNDTAQVCDHINRERLDNRKDNLRIVSYSQNNFNRKKN